jgi:hypothetical protein
MRAEMRVFFPRIFPISIGSIFPAAFVVAEMPHGEGMCRGVLAAVQVRMGPDISVVHRV